MSTELYQGLVKAPAPNSPLIFAFHGTGGDERQFYGLAQSLSPGAGVVSPRGDVSEHGAARFFRRSGEGMYDMADLARATQKMIDYVSAHKAEHPGHPVYGFGYSNGANILASVVMQAPTLFDRVALLHPLVTWDPDSAPALAGRQVLITAGQHDPITPLHKSKALISWFEAQGAKVATQVHPGGHELRQTEVDALARHCASDTVDAVN